MEPPAPYFPSSGLTPCCCPALPLSPLAGATEGFFLGDSGLTCCHYDSVAGTVVLGTDRGVVHFLDATVAVRH